MRRALTAATLALVAMTLVLAATAGAEKPQPTPRPVGSVTFGDEMEVTVVNVDVYVRDGSDRPVAGLGRGDFEILQDGVVMPLSNFAVITEKVFDDLYAPTPPALGPTPTPTPQPDTPSPEIKPILVVLYVDNENVHVLDRNRVLRSLREFVTENLRPPMKMMVVSYQKSLKIDQPFTDDPSAVTAALRTLQQHTAGRNEIDNERKAISERMNEGQGSQSSTGNESDAHYSPQARRSYREILAFADEEANSLSFSVNAIREVVDMLAGVDARKSIIYVSDGLPMVPGEGLMYEYMSVFKDNSILNQRTVYDRSRLFQSLTTSASARGVSLYTIEAQGLTVYDGTSAESRYGTDPLAASIGAKNYQETLRFMADHTGGLAIVNTNDIGPGLGLIKSDLFSYYSLGYTIAATGGDRVHRVEVRVPSHPDYKLRYRERYVEKSLESQVQDRVMSSLVVEVNQNPLQMTLETGSPVPAAGERWTVPVHVAIPLRQIALIPEADVWSGRLVLFVAARDANGQMSDMQRQEQDIKVPAADYDAALAKGWGIDFALLMESGDHQVAVGVMDQVTRQASYARVEVRVK